MYDGAKSKRELLPDRGERSSAVDGVAVLAKSLAVLDVCSDPIGERATAVECWLSPWLSSSGIPLPLAAWLVSPADASVPFVPLLLIVSLPADVSRGRVPSIGM